MIGGSRRDSTGGRPWRGPQEGPLEGECGEVISQCVARVMGLVIIVLTTGCGVIFLLIVHLPHLLVQYLYFKL